MAKQLFTRLWTTSWRKGHISQNADIEGLSEVFTQAGRLAKPKLRQQGEVDEQPRGVGVPDESRKFNQVRILKNN
jgi:hypothetical protein